jgi:hypothetical protein
MDEKGTGFDELAAELIDRARAADLLRTASANDS